MELSSITKIEYSKGDRFFYEGRHYSVTTPEGPIMKAVISKVNEKNMSIQIDAHCSILRSVLTCSVDPISDSSCRLIRVQSYPGIIGSIFTGLFNKR